MWVHPTVTASTIIAHVWCAAQGQMSHSGAVEIFHDYSLHEVWRATMREGGV
jgi:hypothetical protein